MKPSSMAAALALFVLAPAPAPAHAQTFSACYVPKSGSVYRIQVDGASMRCGQNHVEFTWEAGAPAAPPVYLPTTDADAFVVAPGATADLTESGPDGEYLILGGYIKYGPDTPNVEIVASTPDGANNTWVVRANDHGAAPSQVGDFLRCFELLAGS